MVTKEKKDSRKIIDGVLEGFDSKQSSLIPVLQQVQGALGYLPKEALERISTYLDVPLSQVYGVVTFYAQFRLEPSGEHTVRVCHGTACHVSGAEGISDAVGEQLGIDLGETTKDGKFSLESVACLGCCSLAPVIMIDDRTYGRLTPDKAKKVVKQHG